MNAEPDGIQERIVRRLRRHVDAAALGPVCTAVMRGEVVRLETASLAKPAVVAFRHGVLFVGVAAYQITDE